jgi:hypothetical protein
LSFKITNKQERLTLRGTCISERYRMQKRRLTAKSKVDTEPNASLKLDLPQEVIDVITYIQDEFRKPIWLLGLRGLYSLGVPFYRSPEEINIYSPITKAERGKLDDYLRSKYETIVGRRSDHGTSYSFPRAGALEVNRVNQYIETSGFGHPSDDAGKRQKPVEIAERIYVLVPQIEDLVIMKLITGRTKDMRDVRHVLRTSRSRIDMNNLENRAREAGVELKLRRLRRIAS